MAILAFSLTDIFDTIGTLIGTGEKVGIIASTGDNNESKALDRALYSDLVGTVLAPLQGHQMLQLTLNLQQVLVLVDVLV